jgi:hypothetical protein
MSFAKLLSQRFAEPLKVAGYKKKDFNWTRMNDETCLIVNIQKSRWGEWAYVNMGVFVYLLGSEVHPKEYECHIRFRLEDVCPPAEESLISGKDHSILSATPLLPGSIDAEKFTYALKDFGLPVLEKMSTLNDLRSLMSQGQSGSQDRAAQLSQQLTGHFVVLNRVAS